MKAFFENLVKKIEAEESASLEKLMDQKEKEYSEWANEGSPHHYQENCYEEKFFNNAAVLGLEQVDSHFARNINFFGELIETKAVKQAENSDENFFSNLFKK